MQLISKINYDLTFEPFFTGFTFNGKEIISFTAAKSIKSVLLNSAELTIKKCYLIKSGKTIHTKFSVNEKNEINEEEFDDVSFVPMLPGISEDGNEL